MRWERRLIAVIASAAMAVGAVVAVVGTWRQKRASVALGAGAGVGAAVVGAVAYRRLERMF